MTTAGTLRPDGRFPLATSAEVRRELRRQIRLLPGARKRTVLAVLLLAAGALANVSIPLLLGRIVDLATAEQGASSDASGIALGTSEQAAAGMGLWGLTGLLVCAAVASAGLSALGFYLVSTLSERLIATLREEMVTTALGLPVHEVEEAGTGDLVSRSTDDVAELSKAVTETVPILSTSAFTIGATAVALLGLDLRFVLVLVVLVPLYWVAMRSYLRVAPGRYAAERSALAERARRVLEAIRGQHTVRAFRMEGEMHRRIGWASWDVVERSLLARRTMLTLQIWIAVIECTMLLTALALGYHLVGSGALSVGEVTAASLILIRLRGPLMTIMRVLDVVQSGWASLTRIVGVVADPPQPVPPAGAPEPRGEVELRGVSFSYGSGWAVRDIDLSVPAGGSLALVGASGAGKTTVAALLAGLRVPDAGSVTIDGVEVSTLSDVERGDRLAMVSQDVHVFSGTLREDLTLARPDATDDELLEALRRVRADWFEMFPEGLDTEVGARGRTLTPVASQQLALARILLVDPAVVVMDEATAEAGSAGAGALEDAAEEVKKGRTSIVVAHRLDQAARAERIAVMDAGRVVELGSHDELLAAGGRYAQIWAAWSIGR